MSQWVYVLVNSYLFQILFRECPHIIRRKHKAIFKAVFRTKDYNFFLNINISCKLYHKKIYFLRFPFSFDFFFSHKLWHRNSHKLWRRMWSSKEILMHIIFWTLLCKKFLSSGDFFLLKLFKKWNKCSLKRTLLSGSR